MEEYRLTRIICGVLILAFLLAGCSSQPDSPEDQIRSLVRKAEAAAEEKNLSALRGMIAEKYSDPRGNDRSSLLALVRYHFLRNEALHLLVRVASLDLPVSGRADAVVYVAMAGEPIPSPEAVAALRADLYRFEMSLGAESEGEWRLVSASWRPARAADLF